MYLLSKTSFLLLYRRYADDYIYADDADIAKTGRAHWRNLAVVHMDWTKTTRNRKPNDKVERTFNGDTDLVSASSKSFELESRHKTESPAFIFWNWQVICVPLLV